MVQDNVVVVPQTSNTSSSCILNVTNSSSSSEVLTVFFFNTSSTECVALVVNFYTPANYAFSSVANLSTFDNFFLNATTLPIGSIRFVSPSNGTCIFIVQNLMAENMILISGGGSKGSEASNYLVQASGNVYLSRCTFRGSGSNNSHP